MLEPSFQNHYSSNKFGCQNNACPSWLSQILSSVSWARYGKPINFQRLLFKISFSPPKKKLQPSTSKKLNFMRCKCLFVGAQRPVNCQNTHIIGMQWNAFGIIQKSLGKPSTSVFNEKKTRVGSPIKNTPKKSGPTFFLILEKKIRRQWNLIKSFF